MAASPKKKKAKKKKKKDPKGSNQLVQNGHPMTPLNFHFSFRGTKINKQLEYSISTHGRELNAPFC